MLVILGLDALSGFVCMAPELGLDGPVSPQKERSSFCRQDDRLLAYALNFYPGGQHTLSPATFQTKWVLNEGFSPRLQALRQLMTWPPGATPDQIYRR